MKLTTSSLAWLISALSLPLAACGGAPAAPQGGQAQATSAGTSAMQTDKPLTKPEFLDAFAQTYRYRLGQPRAITPTPIGDAVLFLRSGPRSFVGDLYSFDTATGEEKVLLTADQILGGGEETLTEEEKARRERMRLAARGIAGFSLSRDGKQILVPLSGRLFVVTRKTGDIKELKTGEGFPIDPRFSPDGQSVAMVRDGDLYVLPLGGEEVRLTTRKGADDPVSYGTAEFVAQEEMGRYHGYWWSPDGQHIAYQKTDTAGMERFRIADPMKPGTEPTVWPYPRPGGQNASVQLFVQPSGGGDSVEVQWDHKAWPYLATVKWPKAGPMTLVVQDRLQQTHAVLAADPATGKTRVLFQEKDDAWVNLDQQVPRWLPGDQGMLWTTERNGHWQLERRTVEGEHAAWLTPPELNLRQVVHVELKPAQARPPAVYVLAGADPTEQHLFRVPLDPARGKPEQLTEGAGWHEAVFAQTSGLSVVHSAYPDKAAEWVVRGALGAERGRIKSAAEAPALTPDLNFTTVQVPEAGEMHAVIIKPKAFDPAKKYPVFVHVYGGPHAQMVIKNRARYLLDQWFAEQGFVVVALDGRGTPARGRAWERTIYKDFISAPLHDQAEGLKALLARHSYMDGERVGIFGWSFGGYFSAMAVMQRPDVYHVGVSGAPVADWRDYDTHYTERYIGLPNDEAGKKVYDQSSVLTYAEKLTRPLLIMHGTADDNVYFLHALKMSNALFRAGRDHDFLPLIGFTHMVPDPLVARRLYGRIVGYFETHLGDPR